MILLLLPVFYYAWVPLDSYKTLDEPGDSSYNYL